MTPDQFKATYEDLADQMTDQLGLDPSVILAQWAIETAWASQLVGNNLANIRCSPTTFCVYPTLEDFAADYIAVMRQPNMAVILASVGKTVFMQMRALGQSPWDAGHYTTGGNPPGSSLIPFQEALNMATIDDIYNELRGSAAFSKLDLIQARLGMPSPAAGTGPGQVQPFWKDPSFPGGAEVEPKNITLHITSVPGDATGTLT